MAQETTTRYSIVSVRKMITQLERWIDDTTEVIDNEESKNYPNESRIDKLNERLSALEEAKDALESIE